MLDRILAGETVEGVRREDLLHMPHPTSSAAAACPRSSMVGSQGETFTLRPEYLQHLVRALPESYRASRDYKDYVDALTQVATAR